jgi:hypothetical protein
LVWYSKALFGEVWMGLIGFSDADIEKAKEAGMAKTMVVAFIASLVMGYVLANVVDFIQAKTALDGALTGFMIWLGFVATVLLNTVLWEKRPVKLYLINSFQILVSLVVMGAILTVWV